MKPTLGTEVKSVNPINQDKNQRLRKVQAVYRKKKYHKRATINNNGIWKIIVSICVITLFFFLITSALFDIGVPLPKFFGR
jgi:hypothetical protein